MFQIDKNKQITMIQGDTGIIKLMLSNYSLVDGDEVVLGVAIKMGDPILITKTITEFEVDGSAIIHLEPKDTANLAAGKYVYEIQVTTSDGRVDTVVPINTLIIKEGLIYG